MEVSSFKRAFRLRRSAASVFCARSVMRLRVCMGACGRTPLTGGMPRSPQARVCETVVEFKKGYALPSSGSRAENLVCNRAPSSLCEEAGRH